MRSQISAEAVAASRQAFPHLHFVHLDVLQDVHVLIQHLSDKDVVFVDLGGNRALPALIRCLSLLIERVHPALIVVKSEALASMAAMQCAGHAVPARQLKRQLPEVAACVHPGAGYTLAMDHMLPPPAAPCSCRHDEAYPRAGMLNNVHAARLHTVGAHPVVAEQHACVPEGLVPDCGAWWDGVWRPRSCRAGVVVPERWFVTAKAKRFAQHPLKFPWRENADGQPICRLFNYADRSCPSGEACLFDHVHCHHCGAAGHVAQDCDV